MNRIKEKHTVGYMHPQHAPDAYAIAARLRQAAPSSKSDLWPKANQFGLGDAVQWRPSGPYLSRADLEAVLANLADPAAPLPSEPPPGKHGF